MLIDQVIAQARDKFGFIEGYEEDQLRHLEKLLEGATRFVDVGANRGIFAWVANQICRNAEIILVEADPKLGEFLKAEVSTWSQGNDVSVVPCAAGDVEDVLEFHIGKQDTVGTFVTSDFATTGRANVRVAPLDDLLSPTPGTVFKIDVEGFEYRVIQGARVHLAQPGCKILMEVHGWGDQEINKYPIELVSLLFRLRYSATRCGASHFIFVQGSLAERSVSYLKYAPRLFAKSLVRRLGARDAIYRLVGKRQDLSSGLSDDP